METLETQKQTNNSGFREDGNVHVYTTLHWC